MENTASVAQSQGALNEVLESRPFAKSSQHSTLLRYIVIHSLGGEDNLLRERVIGAEVFGRSPDYDTKAKIQIDIPPGAYKATFTPRSEHSSQEQVPPIEAARSLETAKEQPYEPSLEPASTQTSGFARFKPAVLLWSALLVLMVSLALATWLASRSTKLDAFWEPLLASKQPITLCVPDYTLGDLQAPDWASSISAVIAGRLLTAGSTRTRLPDCRWSHSSIPWR